MYFVTSNRSKVEEARAVLGNITWKHLAIPEIQSNSIGNIAKESARYAFSRIKSPLFVEDAGLFIDVLNGFPGPYSRYVFETIGCRGILNLMKGKKSRGARFLAVIAYADKNGKIHLFSGEIRGTISKKVAGKHGFGFDPIFVPIGQKKTFAQDPIYKAKNSHRVRALRKFKAFLG